MQNTDRESLNIIILGNDPSVDKIDFDKLKQTNAILCGVNRIFMVTTHIDYLFFLDNIIINELQSYSLPDTTVITSKYNTRRASNLYNKDYLDTKFKHHIFIDQNVMRFPIFGSVSCLMVIMHDILFPDKDINFYLLGTSLLWNDKQSHFWKNNNLYNTHKIYNRHNKIWYNRRFRSMQRSIRYLSDIKKYKIISCHNNNSMLDFLTNISFDNLLNTLSINDNIY